jgi:hypothetical protein
VRTAPWPRDAPAGEGGRVHRVGPRRGREPRQQGRERAGAGASAMAGRTEPDGASRRAGGGPPRDGHEGEGGSRAEARKEKGEAGGMERTRGERGCARVVGEDVGGAGKMPLARGPPE